MRPHAGVMAAFRISVITSNTSKYFTYPSSKMLKDVDICHGMNIL